MTSRKPDLNILQHALGLDDYGQGRAYRNRFVTEPGTADWPRCMAHVEAGRMERHVPHAMFGSGESYCFVVTDAGRRYAREHSPEPPKMTRSQRRYRAWLLPVLAPTERLDWSYRRGPAACQ